ncbi:MAG: ATP-binding cassette domain-containing protein [Bacilli bacterium]|nr:ATP-binding cassette domain-containing protein [Bacilli bacterium]
MIELKQVTKIYDRNGIGETIGVEDINLILSSKGLVSILGPSGCGKTTLLNLIAGLDKPTKGEVLVDGKKIDDEFRLQHVGCIFQDFVVINDITVAENVRLLDKSLTDAQINDVLKSLGILDLRERKASKLSGGEKQRLCIARAIVRKPAFLIADEPTGNLDEANRSAIMRILKSLSKHYLVILVSHEKDLVERYSDRVIVMDDHRIVSDSAAEESGERFELGAEGQTISPKRKVKRKRSNVIAGILAAATVLAVSFASSFAIGKPESYNHLPDTVFELDKDLGAEARVALSPYAYFGARDLVSQLVVGDAGWSSQRLFFPVAAPTMPYDFYATDSAFPGEESDCVITVALADAILEGAYFGDSNQGVDLKIADFGIRAKEDLLGLRVGQNHRVAGFVDGQEYACYLKPEKFYLQSAVVDCFVGEAVVTLRGSFYSTSTYRRLGLETINDDTIYVGTGSPLTAYTHVTVRDVMYPVSTMDSLDALSVTAILPEGAYANSIAPGKFAYAYDSATFLRFLKGYKVGATSLKELTSKSIQRVIGFFAPAIGAVLAITLLIMALFFSADFSSYFEENKNEFVVYRSLGMSRKKLIHGCLLGVLSGMAPLIGIGAVGGELLTLFFCRDDTAAMVFVPGALTFIIGITLAFVLAIGLSALYLWRRMAPNAAEFKKANQESQF